jgi:RNA polymerase sigma-70 factor (ECF subfamily)
MYLCHIRCIPFVNVMMGGPERMYEQDWLADRFEENRSHLRGVAYRMLGSLSEADDALQETWLRLSRSDAAGIDNLPGWLTTVVARICLDILRARSSRREEVLPGDTAGTAGSSRGHGIDPEQEAVMADAVGVAVLVVLDRLAPAERLAFVLHDMFGLSFDEISPIVGRSTIATRQLASRARRRVQGAGPAANSDVKRQRELTDAFLTALRNGDIESLVNVLDPDVVVRIDEGVARSGVPREIHGALNWAKGAVAFSRGVGVHNVEPALVDGTVGLVWAPNGKMLRAVRFTFAQEKIVQVDIIGDPVRLRDLDLRSLP